jgi:hypothetical protein
MRNCNVDDPNCIETPDSADNPSEPEENPEDTNKKDEIVFTGQKQRRNTRGSREQFFVVTTLYFERRDLRQRDIKCPGGGSVTVGVADPILEGASAAYSHPSSHSGVPGPGDNSFGNTSNTACLITPSRAYAMDRASNGTYGWLGQALENGEIEPAGNAHARDRGVGDERQALPAVVIDQGEAFG